MRIDNDLLLNWIILAKGDVMLPKIKHPYDMTPEFNKKIQSIGKDGYNYRKTEEGLEKATRKMLENSKNHKRKPTE